MNHEKTIAKAKSMKNTTDTESLFDSMLIVAFFYKVLDTKDIQLIHEVHKLIGRKVVVGLDHWQGNSLLFKVADKGLFTLDDPTKQVGDIVVFGEKVGVVRKIEGKIFVVHMTDGQDLPFIAVEDDDQARPTK
jgi:hypothetical protein